MPRRPAALENLKSVASNDTFQITDTMTLIVRGEGGLEMRVRQNGTTHTPQATSNSATSTSTEEMDNSFSDAAAVDKIAYEDLHIGAEIGKGSQGKVRVVQHRKTKVRYALKHIVLDSSSEAVRSLLEAELRQVFAVKHKNVVSSYEAFFRDGRVNIILEYMDAGTMKDIMRRHPRDFSENMLAYIARELLCGLAYLHGLNIIHRDIKPANVLFNSRGEVKIADFGVAKTFSHEDMKTLSAQGSMPYMSPERIQQKPYSFPSDIWSVGLTIAECAIGEYPFISLKSRIFELCQALVNGTAKIEWGRASKKFSPELVSFVDLCLLSYEKRPSAAELLTNAFIKKADAVDARSAGKWFMQKDSK